MDILKRIRKEELKVLENSPIEDFTLNGAKGKFIVDKLEEGDVISYRIDGTFNLRIVGEKPIKALMKKYHLHFFDGVVDLTNLSWKGYDFVQLIEEWSFYSKVTDLSYVGVIGYTVLTHLSKEDFQESLLEEFEER